MLSRQPAHVYDDNGLAWPAGDSYNVIRNVYNSYRDIRDQTDYTHPGKWARLVHLLTMVDTVMYTAQGELPAPVTKRDYNATYDYASAIDFVVGFNLADNVGASTANINWMVAPNTSFDGSIFSDSLIDTSGNPANNVKVYGDFDIVDSKGVGNIVDPTNDTASLENTHLLSGALGLGQKYIRALHVLVEGLEPMKRYDLSVAVSGDPRKSRECYYFLHDGNPTEDIIAIDPAAVNPESEIVTRTCLSDTYGRIYIAVRPHDVNQNLDDAMISGFRIQSAGSVTPSTATVDINIIEPVFSISAGSVTPTSAAIDINISEPVFSIFASNSATVYYYSKGTQVRLF